MKTRTLFSLAMLVIAVSGTAIGADKETTIEAKAEDNPSAATVDFQKALQLPFDSLATLGVRTEQARKAADPVGLASAAAELEAAEKASGKNATIKAADLKKEALTLAKLRDNAAEMLAVQSLLGADLAQEIKAASKREAASLAAAKEGERSKGIFHELIVDNGSEVHVHVYVNGQFVGHLDPYGHGHFHVHTHGETVLDARGFGHRWHSHVHGDHANYHWRLND